MRVRDTTVCLFSSQVLTDYDWGRWKSLWLCAMHAVHFCLLFASTKYYSYDWALLSEEIFLTSKVHPGELGYGSLNEIQQNQIWQSLNCRCLIPAQQRLAEWRRKKYARGLDSFRKVVYWNIVQQVPRWRDMFQCAFLSVKVRPSARWSAPWVKLGKLLKAGSYILGHASSSCAWNFKCQPLNISQCVPGQILSMPLQIVSDLASIRLHWLVLDSLSYLRPRLLSSGRTSVVISAECNQQTEWRKTYFHVFWYFGNRSHCGKGWGSRLRLNWVARPRQELWDLWVPSRTIYTKRQCSIHRLQMQVRYIAIH